jgi:mannose-6-phosphate isomerase-like protein (cupin superfamily)
VADTPDSPATSSSPSPNLAGPGKAHLRAADALSRLPGPAGERFVELFRHGALVVEIYAPRGADLQIPHTRDEVYVVAAGTGTFFDGEDRRPFVPGDLLFVPAGVPHRFEDFTDDFAVWVVFYGPEGGEVGFR